MNFPSSLTREEVLRELERLAQGQHPDQQTPLMRFTRCSDWQKAAELILGALHAASQSRRATRLLAPPGQPSTCLMPAGCGLAIPRLDGVSREQQFTDTRLFRLC